MCFLFCCSSSSFSSIISVFCNSALLKFDRNSFGDIIITPSRCGVAIQTFEHAFLLLIRYFVADHRDAMRKVLLNATRN